MSNILDEVILDVEGNPWTVRDACTGCIVFGMTGSGKSSGPLYKIANKILSLGYGGVVFCAKPDEAATWIKYAEQTNRTGDLLFLSQETFNYLDAEAKRESIGGGQVENLVNLYLEIVNIGKDRNNTGGSNEEYWQNAVKQMLRNAITILKLADEPINIENIHSVVVSAPTNSKDTLEDNGYCSLLIDVIVPETCKNLAEYEIAKTYFFNEFASLDERTRSNTISSFSVAADAMQRGELSRCFSAKKSSLNLEDLYRKGKILILDYDVKSWGRIGQYAAGIIKYCFETMIERRADIADDNAKPVFLWADECQFFSLEYDQKFQTTARSSRTLTIYATQNLGNLYDGYGKEKASSLLGNLGTKFFCQNGEIETNEWAAKSIGQEIIIRRSKTYGDSTSSTMKGEDNQSLSYSEGYNEQKDYRVDPAEFSVLQTGGPRGQCKVGFIFWQSGRILNDGKVFVRAAIEQECKKVCGAKRIRQCPPVPAIGNGKQQAKRSLFQAMDYFCIISLLILSVFPLSGVFLVYTGTDSLLAYINDRLFCSVSTLCFYVIALILDVFFAIVERIPAILKAGKMKEADGQGNGTKIILRQDAILGYYTISVGMTLWLQYNIFNFKEACQILLWWAVLALIFRFLRYSGKQSVKQ